MARERKPVLSDLHAGPGDLPPHVDVIAPFFAGNGEAPAPVGAVILQSDAREFLYPLIQSWPVPSHSAETLLVRRDGDAVLFLNELHHQKDTALKLRIPLTRTDVPAVRAVLGKEGLVQGKDYRGVEVLSVIKAIPDSPWFMVAKVDAAEVLAAGRLASVLILALLLGSVAAAAAAVSAMWQRNARVHYQDLFQAEVEQRKSEEQYRVLFQSSRDAIMTLAPPTWSFTSGNPAAVELFGAKDEAEFVSQAPWQLSPQHQPGGRPSMDQAREMIETAMREGFHFFEWTHKRINGEEFPATVLLTRMNLGEKVLLQATVRDITERKRAEEEKEELQAQLRQAQKMEAVGRLAGGVAHDFNNMLFVIKGYAEMAMKKVDPADRLHHDLQEIQTAAQRSADLTRQLLAFARKQTASPKVLDLNDTAASMLKMLQRLMGEDIELAWMPGHELWNVKIDPSQIDQILANLAVNARDAIAGVGKVSVETANTVLEETQCAAGEGCAPGDYVLLAVSDSGRGMDKEMLANIFEPFFTTKGVGEGTGMGLATVYGIVRQNDGLINVYSEPGQGTTFKIYLPRFVAAEVAVPVESKAAEPEGGTETVLLVEDEEPVLKLGQAILADLGYTVLAANTPGEALRLARNNTGAIDLLITDVVMPGMNGRELAERITSMQPGIRCLYMSGYTADVIADRGVLDEGLRFIQKPFSVDDLARKVREALGVDLDEVPL
jgi:PAS domain S-box-containing protein